MAVNDIVNIKGAEFVVVAECQSLGAPVTRVNTVQLLQMTSIDGLYIVTRNGFIQQFTVSTNSTADVQIARAGFYEAVQSLHMGA